MILVDTSVWVDHFRKNNQQLVGLLEEGVVLCHNMIIGELACGYLKNRNQIIDLMQSLPKTDHAADEEVLTYIETNKIYGKGLGWVDLHLLVSTILEQAKLWTLDKKLAKVAQNFHAAF